MMPIAIMVKAMGKPRKMMTMNSAEHQQGDLRVGHSMILRGSSPCWAASMRISSVSRTSSIGGSQ